MSTGYMNPETVADLAEIREVVLNEKLCTEGVTRRGEFEPCEALAVAVRYDPEEGKPYAVCARHACADMVKLFVIAAAIDGAS